MFQKIVAEKMCFMTNNFLSKIMLFMKWV